MRTRIVGLLVVACLPASALATTWGESKIEDPISGGRCVVQVPHSSGSYVYQWPEKYDQVFWPFTDSNGVWSCAKSGFATFIGDVELPETERESIRAFLKHAPRLNTTNRIAVLDRVGAIYALRKLDPDTETRVARSLAYQYEQAGAQSTADVLRTRAAALMRARLQDATLPPELRLQYLFVVANYAREQGRTTEADGVLEQLTALLAEVGADQTLKNYAAYLAGLIEPSRTIVPGARLAPPDS